MTNRRKFLKSASLLAASGVLATGCNMPTAASATAPKKSFGLQTWSLGAELRDDVPGGLKKLAEMGYTYLELNGYNRNEGSFGRVPMAEYKKMANDVGIEIVSSHVGSAERGLHTRENFQSHLDHWKIAIDHHAAIGCKYIIQPGHPVTRSIEEVALIGEHYNEIGRIAKAAGIKFGFHNHEFEFRFVVSGGEDMLPFGQRRGLPEGAKTVFDVLLESTDPTLVTFELDVYWTVMGQNCPVNYMKRYPNHIRLLHVKDIGILGRSGMLNFQNIFDTAYSLGIEDFFVELEGLGAVPEHIGGGVTQFEGARLSAEYLINAPYFRW